MVPDDDADDTTHTQTGNSGNRAQGDWNQIVDNRSSHQYLSRGESNRLLEDSQEVSYRIGIWITSRQYIGQNNGSRVVVPSNTSFNVSHSLQSEAHGNQIWRKASLPHERCSTPLRGANKTLNSPGLSPVRSQSTRLVSFQSLRMSDPWSSQLMHHHSPESERAEVPGAEIPMQLLKVTTP